MSSSSKDEKQKRVIRKTPKMTNVPSKLAPYQQLSGMTGTPDIGKEQPLPPHVKWRNSVKARVKDILTALNKCPVYIESYDERRFLQEIVRIAFKGVINSIDVMDNCIRWKYATKVPLSTIMYTMDGYFDLIDELTRPITLPYPHVIAAIRLEDHESLGNVLNFIKYCTRSFIGSEQCLKLLFHRHDLIYRR